MREHNHAFCRLVAESFDCPSPVYEFGAFQVEGQEHIADLRGLFPSTPYVGCDMRPGKGVDRVEDVTALSLPDSSAGTVLCIETFEHVFEVRRAFDEVFRVLKPGGVFILTSPLNFRIHGYPDDYWRFTPNCLRRMLQPYGGRVVGGQGHAAFPHTVMSLALKGPEPADFQARAEQLRVRYNDWLATAERSRPTAEKFRKRLAMLYRSKGERRHLAEYYRADLTIDRGTAQNNLSLAG